MASAEIASAGDESSFNEWVDRLAEEVKNEGFAVRDGISSCSGVDVALCRTEAESLRGNMKSATISTGIKNDANLQKRSDQVTFLKQSEDLSSSSPNLYRHLKWIDKLRAALELRLELKMEQCTYMLAEYPSGGARYIKHRDAAPSEYAGRKLTALFYLNPGWSEKDGGALHLWSGKAEDEAPLVLEPIIDRLVIFKSYMEHEVQPAYFHRIALTTWFVNRRHQALELMCEHLSLKQDEQDARDEQPSSQQHAAGDTKKS